ncbi:MAG TPA: hypothetical protein VKL19_17220 [Thermoanaerobaculia bacterium]|nr:hypothetical protein [Thermoanaerobaculia bacterium]
MTKLRRLNPQGVEEFRRYLQQIREGADFQPSPAILHIDDYSPRVNPAIEVQSLKFETKFTAAQYLSEILAPLDGPALAGDIGLWSWLALYYFDQLSPKNVDGKRRPRQDYHYIPSSQSWHHDRHLLSGPYKLYMLHRERARLLLYPSVHEHGAFVYDLGFRRDLITNRGLIEAIDLLYWDAKRNRPKMGATTTTRPGNLRRLIAVLQQLDFNYDLYGMTAREILDLLPPEFDAWRPVPPTPRRGAARGARAEAP